MRIRPLFLFGTGRHLSNGTIRFVTRRAAFASAAASAAVAAAISLALGAMLGMQWAERDAAGHRAASGAERDYVVDELGKLNASVAQIEPRIARLTAHVGELRNLDARLKAPMASQRPPGSAGDVAANGGEGGPALPPRHCGSHADPVPAALVGTSQQIECMTETLDRLEKEIVTHVVAWAALPGRTPVEDGHFGSPFGNRLDPFSRRLSFHSGIDLSAPKGTPILATAGGRVSFAGQKSGYGNVVEIDHGNQLVTRYGHASRILVHEGDLVLPRQHIADVGSTGRSTGPHLHFEVVEHGEQTDPAGYLSLFAASSNG